LVKALARAIEAVLVESIATPAAIPNVDEPPAVDRVRPVKYERSTGPCVDPVPPAVTGRVPVVKTEVEVAYTAPPLVNDVRFVPP
jgi:hypothetical protein